MVSKNLLKEYIEHSKGKPLHLEGDLWLVPCALNSPDNCYFPLHKPLDSSSIDTNSYTKKSQ